jgi:two-component system, NtrC family, response regulator GlrR
MSDALLGLCGSGKMQPIRDLVSKVAVTNTTVLLRGESGVGKEVVARAIHKASPRAARQFLKVNCAALPGELLESELFGHEKGAFTGAYRQKPGKFEAADQGTLLLDEIGEMPLRLQAKLLHVLQDGEFSRVGGEKIIDTDVRLIAATNRDLEASMRMHQFREDLYYRLNVVKLYIPTLAERREDIPLLANAFLSRLVARYRRERLAFSPEAMELMVSATWPGNVRQLLNVVEQAVALAATDVIPESLVRQALDAGDTALTPLDEARRAFERDYLVRILKITGGNVTKAARLAGRNRTEFYRLLERHALEPSLFKAA